MPSKGSAKKPELTVGDRLVTGVFGGILGFLTMALIWLIVLYFGGRRGADVSLPFYWTWLVGGATAAVSFLLGPERMMDGFGSVWRFVGSIFLPGRE
jgi:hypothetical protein